MSKLLFPRLVSAALAFFITACGSGGGGASSDATLESLIISPGAPQTAFYKPIQLRADAVYSDGTVVDVTNRASWSSSKPELALVAAGLVTPELEGTTAVTAVFETVSASVPLRVITPVVDRVEISGRALTATIGGFSTFVATAFFDDGTTDNIAAFADYAVEDPGIASVTSNRVRGIRQGATRVTGQFLGVPFQFFVIAAGSDQGTLRQRATNVYSGTFDDGTGTYDGYAVITPDGAYRHVVFGIDRPWATFDGYASFAANLTAVVGGTYYRAHPTFAEVTDGSISIAVTQDVRLEGSFVGPDGRNVRVELNEVPPDIVPYNAAVLGSYINFPPNSIHDASDPGAPWTLTVRDLGALDGVDSLGCSHVATTRPADTAKGLMYIALEIDCPAPVAFGLREFTGVIFPNVSGGSKAIRYLAFTPDRTEALYDEAFQSIAPASAAFGGAAKSVSSGTRHMPLAQ